MANELIVDFPAQPRRYSLRPGASSTSSRVRCRSLSFDDCQEGGERRHRRNMNKSGQSSFARRHSYQPHFSSDPTPSAARSVCFSEHSSLKVVTKHGDRADVSYTDLWYTSTDIDLMKFAAARDARAVRKQIAAGVSNDRLMNHTSNTDSSTVCLTGIENRLTQESTDEVKACRARCVLAVLLEQERQQEMGLCSVLLALASLSQTRECALRARGIGSRQQEDVMKS